MNVISSFLISFGMFFPSLAIYLWFTLAFWGVRPARYGARMVGFALPFSIYLALAFPAAPSHWDLLMSLLVCFILMFACYNMLKIQIIVYLFLFFSCTGAVASVISHIIRYHHGDILAFAMPSGQGLRLLAAAVPAALCALAAWLLHARKLAPGSRLYGMVQEAKNVPAHYLLLSVFMQMLLNLLFAIHFIDQSGHAKRLLFLAGIVPVAVVGSLTIWTIIRMQQDAAKMTQNALMDDMLQMLIKIRGQRHDFANHIQVMHTLLKLKRFDRLSSYMEELVEDIQYVAHIEGEIASPALAALIHSKTALALKQEIQFDCKLGHGAGERLPAKNIELVKIVGNLIDNAFEEVCSLPPAERLVTLELFTEQSAMVIRIANRGKPLPTEALENLFSPGYTTKADGHSGMGLPIILQSLKRYKGQINVESDEVRGIVFTVKIPLEG